MTIAIIGGVAAVLLLLAVLVMRRRKSAPPAASTPAQPAIEPQRRRSVGPSLATSDAPVAELDPPLDEQPPEPRRRVAIGLTPWDAAEPAPVEASGDSDEEPVDEVAQLEQEAPAEEAELLELEAPLEEAPPYLPEAAAQAIDEPFVEEVAPPPPAPPAEEGDPPSILTQLKVKKKSGPNALAGAVEGAVSSAPAGPSEVEETVSLVLRRQVPPRLDEAPRSWLGGLPMMLDAVEWPRSVSPERIDEGEVPLHFVAQIACADFPEDLWGGVGPRSGWLLFFLNPLDSQGDDPRVFRVVHIDELGPERQPPEDLGPVQDEELADGDYLWCRSAAEIPSTFRRWPVDFVAVPNEAHDDGYKMVVTPKAFAGK